MMLRIALLLMSTFVVAACGTSAKRDFPHLDARNQPPLVVPEGLDRPLVDQTMRIPERPARRVAPGRSAVSDGTLLVADHPESAFRRIGLALERMAGEVEILDRDPGQGSFRLQVESSRRATGMARLVRREERVTRDIVLTLEAGAEGTRVRGTGDADTVRALLNALRRRLG
ncbi:MAG: hypothetical protein KF823_15485 [Xanthomonadales bacterium]|nr:hypothetical protein [Xanthomonadales bacterium]